MDQLKDFIDEMSTDDLQKYKEIKDNYINNLNKQILRENKYRAVFFVGIIISIALLVIGIIDIAHWKIGVMGIVCPVVSIVLDAVSIFISFLYRSKN